MSQKEWGFNTRAIRGAVQRTNEKEHNEAIFTTSSFVFDTAEEAALVFSGREEGNSYARYSNPSLQAFERRLAALEGAEACVATSSGMAAILATCMALLQQGDHIVTSLNVFGSTISLLDGYMGKFGVDTSTVSLTNLDEWEAAIRPNTKMLFLETPSNPLNEVGDLEALAKLAHDNGALLVVDNCFCTPALQQPIRFGADIIIHSATKYLDGQGRCLGGAVLGRQEHMDEVFKFLRSGGPCMSPFNAWVFLKGMETLGLRMKAHAAGAAEVASWLSTHEMVKKVYYCGLPDHPGNALAKKQQSAFGAVLAFEIKGGQKEAWSLIDNTQLLSITGNLGDVKTTITHPDSTTHHRLSPEQKAKAGITPGLIRIAVGLEDPQDLINDLKAALSRV